MKRLAGVVALVAMLPVLAMAQQGYTVTRPGQMPTYVNPNGAGGYTVTTPGQMPTYVQPNGAGGYVVQTPGQIPTNVQPNGPVQPCIGWNCR